MADSSVHNLTSYAVEGAIASRERSLRGILVWAGGSAVAGALIGLAIEILTNFVDGRPIEWWFVQQSVLSAEAIGLSALVGTRYAFPQLEKLAAPLQAGVVFLTLLGGTVAATLFSLLIRPGVLFSRPYAFLGLFAANTILALLVGGSLVMWESLKRSLARAYDQIRVTEGYEREMRLAREVQLELLPQRAPDVPNLDIAFCCQPAKVVGGDTIEFLDMVDGRLGVAVADVVGKGIAAALLMANLQALIRAIGPRERSPARVNGILSEVIHARSRPGRFVTFAFVVLDPATGEISYSLAGHHPPLIVREGGVRELVIGGLPLGVEPGIPYQEHSDRLEPGETLLLYTDGVVEAPPDDGHEEEYGKQRLMDVAIAACGEGPDAIRDRVLADLERFTHGRPRADDTTLIVIRRRAADAAVEDA